MRLLVCGGRYYNHFRVVFDELDRINGYGLIAAVIHGGSNGADTLAGQWARMRGVHAEVFPANWAQYGRTAGPRRNSEMLERGKPEMAIAFPGGTGTIDMVRKLKKAGVRVIEVPF